MRRLIRSFFRKKGYDIIKFKKENMGLYPYYDMSKFVKTHKPVLFDVGANLGQTEKILMKFFRKLQFTLLNLRRIPLKSYKTKHQT